MNCQHLCKTLSKLLLLFIPATLLANPKPDIEDDLIVLPASSKTSLIGTRYTDETVFKNQFFALFESQVSYQHADFNLGINIKDDTLELNQFMFDVYKDNYELQIGKFVTQVGVLDFFGNTGNLNPLRLDYYDEENINVRRQSTWLAQLNILTDEDSNARLIIAPYDAKRRLYLESSQAVTYESGVPFLLLNTGNENLDLIAREILLPVYEQLGGRTAIESYVKNEIPEDKIALDTTTVLLDYSTYIKDAKVGLTYINGLSNIPRFEIDEDLIEAVANLEEEDRGDYVGDYLSKEDNAPIKSVEYSRFQQMLAYGETTINNFGIRGELSYRDRFPLTNQYTNQINLGMGIDHQGWVYNNVELQYSYMPQANLRSYFILWQLSLDKYRLNDWYWQVENTSTLAVVDKESAWALIPGINFTKDQFSVHAKYLHHSQDGFSNNMAMLQVKVLF